MTAEVAVMNRLAVALAADSAVTINAGNETKIYQTENKLFELSETKPVGLMIYNSTTFFGIPWEIIIKDFRKKHGNLNTETVFGWVPVFTQFLMEHYKPTAAQQDDFVRALLYQVFDDIRDQFGQSAIGVALTEFPDTDEGKKQRSDAFRKKFHEAMDRAILSYESIAEFDTITMAEAKAWLKVHAKPYREIIKHFFNGLPLRTSEHAKLRKLAACALKCSRPTDFTTGLVFAGFGDAELFPSLLCIEIAGVIGDKLKIAEQEKVDIDRKSSTGAVIPFAQRETADSLIYGRSTEFELAVLQHFQNVIEEVGFAIVEQAFRQEADRDTFKPRVMRAAEAAAERYIKEISRELRDYFFSDVLDNIRAMPKQELATFAEALVNVTSIKRKVSVGPETVGGPIDVAVISRHEGFVWVKRKHYFPSELNPRYTWRAYWRRETMTDDQKRP